MKCGARVAIGVAGGYFLGRTKKMKLALMLGGMAAGRRAGGPGELLGQGAKLLQSSPELVALREQITTRLVEAGKDAVKAAAARQIGALTDRVSGRVESLVDPERIGAVRPRKGRGKADDADDVSDVDELDEEDATDPSGPNGRVDDDADEEADDDREGAAPAASKRPTRARSTSANSSRSRTSAKNGASQGRASSGAKTSSADSATPKRRTGTAAASRATGTARSATKSTRTARGSRSAR